MTAPICLYVMAADHGSPVGFVYFPRPTDMKATETGEEI